MNASSIDIKDMLEAESSLDLTFGTDLYVGIEPLKPNNTVTIFDTYGRPPQLLLSSSGIYEYPAVQIRVRNTDYRNGWNLIMKIRDSLHGRAQETWNGASAEGKILIKDRIADSIFQQLLLRPDEYDILATTNLNGDYLSDAAAAQVGGLGMAPGSNVRDDIALFEATHGTAPKYAGMDKVNPGSLLLSGVMMLEFMKWNKPAEMIKRSLQKTILQKCVTYDLARQLDNVTPVKTSEFGDAIINNL